MIKMLNNLTISFNQGVEDKIHSTSEITTFPFAVAIEGVNLSTVPRKFIIDLWQNKIVQNIGWPSTKTKTRVQLSPCDLTDWSNYGA